MCHLYTWERLSLEVRCWANEICGFLETSPRWQHRRPQLPSPLEISSVAAVLDQHTSRRRSENMWWGYEYTVMRVWIHCDEGVNTLWWGCEWCVNGERCMKSCTYLMYDVRSFEVSIYLWNHHANLCSKHITSKWFLLPWEKLCFGI